MKIAYIFDPEAAPSGQINTTILASLQQKLVFMNLSGINLQLTLPNSDVAFLGAGQRRTFKTDDWPNPFVQWARLGPVFQSIGQKTLMTFPQAGATPTNVQADQLVIVELFGKDEDIETTLPFYISSQIGIANRLKSNDMLANLWESFVTTFTGNTNPSFTPSVQPGSLYYLKGFHIGVSTNSGTGAAIKPLFINFTSVAGSPNGALGWQYQLDTAAPIKDTVTFPDPGIASVDPATPITMNLVFSGALGTTASGTYSQWGYYVPFGG